MALLPDFFKDCVVAIGTEIEKNNEEKEKIYIGTGFLVGYCINLEEADPMKKEYEIFLITNKHVINKRKNILVKFNGPNDEKTKDYLVDLVDKDGNKLYSTCGVENIDIVAIYINPYVLINDKSIFAYFSLDVHALTVQQMQEQNIAEGDFIYTLGYPMSIVDSVKNVPICRMGCIAYISKILRYGMQDLNFLIDSQTFPGNSGGPVILKPEAIALSGTKCTPQAMLIGVLHSYIPYRDNCISIQTGEVTQIHKENSGLTLVHPVDLIIKAVEEERKRVVCIKEKNNK